jgi:hypothetical protein
MSLIPAPYQGRARVVLAASLGFVTSVAIAWRVSYRYHTSLSGGQTNRWLAGAPDHPTCIDHERGTGYKAVDAVGLWITPPEQPLNPDVLADYPAQNYTIPAWAGMPDEAQSERQVQTVAAGWPLLCLAGGNRARFGYVGGQKHLVYRSANTIYQVRVGFSGFGLLPIGVLWPGMLADTLLWGVPWWCALAAPMFVRNRWRRRRARCEVCGYSLVGLAAGSPCPECGTRTASDLTPNSMHQS